MHDQLFQSSHIIKKHSALIHHDTFFWHGFLSIFLIINKRYTSYSKLYFSALVLLFFCLLVFTYIFFSKKKASKSLEIFAKATPEGDLQRVEKKANVYIKRSGKQCERRFVSEEKPVCACVHTA